MKTLLLSVLCLVSLSVVVLCVWRQLDHRTDDAQINRLLATQPANPLLFSKELVADLPEPARRYFTFTIQQGTPLHTVVEIEMEGQFSLGSRDNPDYMNMKAKQVLALPEGFLWKMAAARGMLTISGSDSATWTRFWLAGLIPVARTGGTSDHSRSAFGRSLAEAVFWTPAAILTLPDAMWEAMDENTARLKLVKDGETHAIDVTVDPVGRPTQVAFQRWSNANPQQVFRLQPFGGHLSQFRQFGGFRLPTRVESGNFFGTDEYFPFYIANVAGIRFPVPAQKR